MAMHAIALVVTGILAAAEEDNEFVLWAGVAGAALLVGLLAWWAVRWRTAELHRRDRAHRRDPDWGSRPSDGMGL